MARKRKQIPANVKAMLTVCNGVDEWLEKDPKHQALVFLSDGKNYTFVLVNSDDIRPDITYPFMDDPVAMCRFLGIAESVECTRDFLLEDPEYKRTYERIMKEECYGVEPEKDQIRCFGIVEDEMRTPVKTTKTTKL